MWLQVHRVVYFALNSSLFLRWPNTLVFQNSKTPSSCLGVEYISVRREIWQICQFTRPDLKENVNQENLFSIFSWSISVWSPPAKVISYLRGNQPVKIKDSYLGMLHNDLYSDYNYYGSQVYVPGSKKLEYKQQYAEATYSIEAVIDHHKPMVAFHYAKPAGQW